MMALADVHLSEEAIRRAGILDAGAVRRMLSEASADTSSRARKVQLDAMINHALGVQILHRHFIQGNVPARAAEMAESLGWKAAA